MFKICEGSYNTIEDGINIYQLFEYQKKTTSKKITYYNDILAFDIETSSFKDFDEEAYLYQDDAVYNHLKGVKIHIDNNIYKEFPDFNLIRRDLFGRIYFSKIDGISIDSLYNELLDLFPYHFSEDIINPYDQLEKIIEVFKDNAPEKRETDDKRGLMYVWQIAINGRVIIGRTWEQFVNLINGISDKLNLSDDKRLIIWVHNLAFEFQFMKDYFNWKKVFAISSRKPIYALTDNGIEFRCSYILSNLSLESCGKALTRYKVNKLVGNLDYELIRHSETPLTANEINYIINDVLVVSAYIKEAIEECNNDITKLPLTCTGYCRNFVRKNCLGNKDSKQFLKYNKMINKLTISGPDEWRQMQRAFIGGFTHSSTRYSFRTLENVDSFDFTSSYPYALVSEKYPMSKGTKVKINSFDEMKKYLDLYFCIFDVKFINIKPEYINENYISISKCFEIKNAVSNNGRLVGADEISTTISSIDFDIIRRVYRWTDMKIGTFRIYKKDYLPREIIMSILSVYKDKTELKGVTSEDGSIESFYQRQKGLLNSIYGCCVTSVIRSSHEYKEGQWVIEHQDEEKELKKYNKSKKRFLFYPWGIACTAYARRNLWSGILAFGDDYIYSDTDSLKVINAEKHMDYINKYNKLVEKKLKKVSEHYNIPFEMFAPKTVKGETKMLGVWDKETEEGKWKKFRTIGAKRYMILTHDDKLTITVSGVNKRYAAPYLEEKYGKEGAFSAFTNDLQIPADHTGKLTHYYLDNGYQGEVCDYLGNTIKYKCKSGIYLEKASYNFSMETAYLDYLRTLRGEIIA